MTKMTNQRQKVLFLDHNLMVFVNIWIHIIVQTCYIKTKDHHQCRYHHYHVTVIEQMILLGHALVWAMIWQYDITHEPMIWSCDFRPIVTVMFSLPCQNRILLLFVLFFLCHVFFCSGLRTKLLHQNRLSWDSDEVVWQIKLLQFMKTSADFYLVDVFVVF